MKKKDHGFMHNDRLGYMCTCPTNLGTVMCCSVHVRLAHLEKVRVVEFNPLRPRQNGRHFPDDIFKCIFVNENV